MKMLVRVDIQDDLLVYKRIMAKSKLSNLTQDTVKKNGKKMAIVNDKIVRRWWTYNTQYPKMLVDHFTKFKPYREEHNGVTGKTDKVANDYPTLESFRVKHQIPPSTRWYWTKEYPELKEAVELVQDMKREFLIQNGLHWTYNAQMAKFIGMNDLGMSEKKEVSNTANISDSQRKKMVLEYLQDIKDWWTIEVLDSKTIDDKNEEGS